ncbi:hypothetical protein IU459_29425 [Nocardia amamiensis]|uniref:Uncharacterized protein n=1 Tax=Nocardia amamiensis TaxID=404578 RepID=A0ABS0CYF2_9NOCA|nr:hypothetical protein [Nocardia amamiensis]MBF6301629.1 hypothetical protein [Nocardia amamiensis]
MGRVLTRDEMLLDVIHIVRKRRWGGQAETPAETRALMRAEVVYMPESLPVGTCTVPEPELVEVLETVAQRALDWLNDSSPAGYRFTMDDGLRLDPVMDLDSEHVAPEAVIAAARSRGLEIPPEIERLAAAHVVGPPHGENWRAVYNVASVAAGPFETEAAVTAAVRAGRNRLSEHLRSSGAPDLADTFTRWIEIPVDR